MPEITTKQDLVVALAEKVLGWKLFRSGRGSLWARVDESDEGRDVLIEQRHPWDEVPVWNPLESITDALMIQQAMHERGFWFKATSPWTLGSQWYGGFTPHGRTGWNGRPDHNAKGNSLAFVISVSAACAVGIEVRL